MDPFIQLYRQQIQDLNEQIQELVEAIEIYEEIANFIEPLNENELLAEEEKKKWIQGAIKKEGALRKALKTKEGKNIPQGKLEAAAKKPGKMGARARLAMKLKEMSKKKKNKEKE